MSLIGRLRAIREWWVDPFGLKRLPCPNYPDVACGQWGMVSPEFGGLTHYEHGFPLPEPPAKPRNYTNSRGPGAPCRAWWAGAVLLALATPAAAQPVYTSLGEQRNVCKVTDGTDTASVTAAGRLEVDGSGVTQPVSGTVTANAGSGTFGVGDGSGALTVDGTLTCNAGTGTLAVSGPLTDAQLRAAAVPITDGSGALNVIIDSGTTAATQSGTWTVQPGNTANTTPWLAKINDGTDSALVSGSGSLQVTCDNCGSATPFEDDDAFTGGTSSVSSIGALYDTTPPAITDGSAGIPRMNSSRVLLTDGSGSTQPISAASLPLPSGASTAANQSTANTSLGTIAGAVSGTEMQVDVLTSALPTGAATAANQTTTIGHVDGVEGLLTTIDGDTGALAGALYTEDVAAAADPVGGALVMVRDDALSGQTTTDGDNVAARGTDKGELYVKHVDAIPVTDNGGALTVDGTVTVGDGAGALNVIVDSGALTATVTDGAGALNTIVDSGTITPAGAAADGAAVSGNPVRIAGKDGSGNTQDVLTDTGGAVQVDVESLPSVTIGTFPDNEPLNVAQMNGVTVTMGNGASGTGVQRITIADDSTGEVRVADDGGNQIPSATTAPAGTARGLNVRPIFEDPCSNESHTYFPIDISTATTTLVATGVGGQHVFFCSLNLVTQAANNVAIVAGTGATCATSTAGMNGGVTAGEGWNFAANGGIALANGGHAHMRTESTGDSVCVITSATTQLSGTLSYVIE